MGRFTENSTIKELLDDKESRAIIEKYLPNITKHPMISAGYNYTIGKALGYRMMIGLSAEKAEAIKNELFALK